MKRGLLNCKSTIRGYVQGALGNNELLASFVEHFEENHGNTISVCLQCYIPKLSQERCFVLPLCCMGLCKGCSTKEGIDSLFHGSL